MTEKDGGPLDRRGFLKACGRMGALGALSFLGFKAISGLIQGRNTLPGQTCRSDGICPRCSFTPGCGLPQALSFKRGTGRS